LNPTRDPNTPAAADGGAASTGGSAAVRAARDGAAHVLGAAPAEFGHNPDATAAPNVPRPAGWVALVGAGPGDEGLLTIRAVDLLAQADVVVAAPELATRLRHRIRPDAELTDPAELAGDARAMVKAARAGQRVVRLYPGDPFLFSPGAEVAAVCVKAGVWLEVVPGVPPATAVPAYAGIPLGADLGADLRIVHAAEVNRIPAGPGSVVVVGAETGPADIAKMLIGAGWTEDTPFAVTWNGTTTAQRTVTSTLGGLAADLKAAGVSLLTTSGPAVAVAGPAVTASGKLSWFETRPLFGWRVLVPRTKEQAGALSERLSAHGAVPEEVPTITVEPPRTPQQMERAVKGLVTGRYQWIAFTSVNAVRAVREKFEEYGLDARAFAGVKVAAVGEQTADALRAFGITPDLLPEGQQSSEGLAAVWPPYDELLDPINRVLLPRADIATETLVAALTELGWEADDVTAYRTVRAAPPPAAVREAIKGGGFDAVLFTSSSTVRNLVGIAGKPHAVTVIAVIGPQTAKTAEEFGLRVDVMAARPSVTALVEALAEHGTRLRVAALAAGEQVRRPSQRRRGARRRAN
jgi:uroporphyrinogen III methyltransferase/synthase